MHYVMSDIHGQYDVFIKMLNKISFSNDDILYILGDIIDRGPQSLELIDYVMNTPNVKFCLGNHEDALIKCLSNPNHQDTQIWTYWLSHGGEETFSSLNKQGYSYINKIYHFFCNSPLYFIHDNFILVHAGIYSNIQHSSLDDLMSKQRDSYILWSKYDFLTNPVNIKGTVIFGHTPCTEIQRVRDEQIKDYKIWKDTNRIGIDCALCYGGKLGCLCLEDMSEFYV